MFDSGIGGLSILKALRAELPEESFIYVADSSHAPYGERDPAHVMGRARALTAYLVSQGVEALVVACNTATAAAIHQLRAEHPTLPIVGVEPALKPAAALSKSGHIGVMATRGTLESSKFRQLHDSLDGQAHFKLQPCDGLATAIERSVDGSAESAAHLAELCALHVKALGLGGDALIDTVVLGCTHYPFAAPLLRELMGDVTLVDPGEAVARQTRARLAALTHRLPQPVPPQLVLLATGEASALQHAARRWISPDAQAYTLRID